MRGALVAPPAARLERARGVVDVLAAEDAEVPGVADFLARGALRGRMGPGLGAVLPCCCWPPARPML